METLQAASGGQNNCASRFAFRYSVWKDGNLNIYTQDGKLVVLVPIRYSASIQDNCFPKHYQEACSSKAHGACKQLVIKTETTVEIGPDWSFLPHISLSNRSGDNWTPEIPWFDESLNIADVIAEQTHTLFAALATKALLADTAGFSNSLHRAWQQLGSPLPLEDSTWQLLLQPQDLFGPIFVAVNKQLALRFHVLVDPILTPANESFTPNAAPSPAVARPSPAAPSAFLHIIYKQPVSAAYANEYLNRRLQNLPRQSSDPNTFELSNIALYSWDTQITIKLTVAEAGGITLNRVAYVIGVPDFEPAESTLYFKELAFDESSQSLLQSLPKQYTDSPNFNRELREVLKIDLRGLLKRGTAQFLKSIKGHVEDIDYKGAIEQATFVGTAPSDLGAAFGNVAFQLDGALNFTCTVAATTP